jgi:type IV pilus assembly protein PilB
MNNDDIILHLKDELAHVCLDQGLVNVDDFDRIVSHVKNTGDSIYDLMQKDGLVSESKVLNALEKKYGIQVAINVKPMKPYLKNFPYAFCIKSGLVPIGDDGISLNIGVCAPSSLNSLKNLNLLTGRKVSAKFISISLLAQMLSKSNEKIVPDTETKSDNKGNANQLNEISPSPDVKIPQMQLPGIPEVVIGPDGKPPVYNRRKEDKKNLITLSGDVINAVEDIMSNAVNTGVSDIHFEIFKDGAGVRFRKNGTMVKIPEYEKFINDNYNAVIARIKILANLDIAERRLPQDGKISFKTKEGGEVDFRVSVLPTILGERIVIRVLNSSAVAISVDSLGLTDHQKILFTEAISAPQGMVLVTGPTGSGKTTTLYGAINYLNKPNVNILTAEDPIEYTVSGISQLQVREDIGLTFASALRSFLRQDPEIILVGEIRDTETADIATKAALTGHLVLSTLHTNSAIGAINRLINMGLPAYLVSSALSLIVAQRLVRKNCQHCNSETHVDDGLGEKIAESIPSLKGFRLMQGAGCEHCAQTGYSGRRAVHEVLKITPQLQKAIIDNKSEIELYEIAKKEGFELISEVALDYVRSGELSLEEYHRVIPQVSGNKVPL